MLKFVGVVALLGMLACNGPAGPFEAVEPEPQADDEEWAAPVELGTRDGRITWGENLHFVSRVAGRADLHHRVSDDEGLTWSEPVAIPGAGAPPLYGTFIAEGRHLYLLTEDADGHLYFRKSTNEGQTWSSAVRLSATAIERPHRVSIAVRGNFVHVVNSREFNAGPARKIQYWRSSDGGNSFTNMIVLDDHTDGPVNPDVAVEGSLVHVVYERVDESDRPIYYLRSTDNGSTWDAPRKLSEPGGQPSIRPRLVAMDGILIVAWEQRVTAIPDDRDIVVRRSLDQGTTWSAIRFATQSPGLYYSHPVIAGRSGGVVVIAFPGGEGTRIADHASRATISKDYGVTWNQDQVISEEMAQPFAAAVSATAAHVIVRNGRFFYARRSVSP
jgi:hypothetical protein